MIAATEYRLLSALGEAPSGLDLRQLGERTGIDQTTAQRVLWPLLGDGVVTRTERHGWRTNRKGGKYIYRSKP